MVWELYETEAIVEAVDEKLKGGNWQQLLDDDGDYKWQMHRTLVVGLWCTHPCPCARPSLMQLMNVLQSKDVTLPTLSRPRSGVSLGMHGDNALSSANVCSGCLGQ